MCYLLIMRRYAFFCFFLICFFAPLSRFVFAFSIESFKNGGSSSDANGSSSTGSQTQTGQTAAAPSVTTVGGVSVAPKFGSSRPTMGTLGTTTTMSVGSDIPAVQSATPQNSMQQSMGSGFTLGSSSNANTSGMAVAPTAGVATNTAAKPSVLSSEFKMGQSSSFFSPNPANPGTADSGTSGSSSGSSAS